MLKRKRLPPDADARRHQSLAEIGGFSPIVAVVRRES
jgi:hypothetical protein